MGYGQYSGPYGQALSRKAKGERHAWAHQNVTWGNRSDRRMYFEPDEGPRGRVSTIYSYGSHFPIASLYIRKGAHIVLYVRRAIPGDWPVHEVARPREPDEAKDPKKRRTLGAVRAAEILTEDANKFALLAASGRAIVAWRNDPSSLQPSAHASRSHWRTLDYREAPEWTQAELERRNAARCYGLNRAKETKVLLYLSTGLIIGWSRTT